MDPISNNPNSNNPQDLASTNTDQHALNLNTPSVTDNSLPTSNTANLDATNRSLVGTIELLEERAVVDKERLDIGKVTVTKQVRTKTINVPVELVEEVMVIETEYYDADSRQFLTTTASDEDLIRHIEPTLQSRPSITVNGTEMFLDQEPIEIVLSRQVAVIKKETYAVQDVAIEKSTHIHKDTFDVELKHEELDVKEEGYFDHEVRRP